MSPRTMTARIVDAHRASVSRGKKSYASRKVLVAPILGQIRAAMGFDRISLSAERLAKVASAGDGPLAPPPPKPFRATRPAHAPARRACGARANRLRIRQSTSRRTSSSCRAAGRPLAGSRSSMDRRDDAESRYALQPPGGGRGARRRGGSSSTKMWRSGAVGRRERRSGRAHERMSRRTEERTSVRAYERTRRAGGIVG